MKIAEIRRAVAFSITADNRHEHETTYGEWSRDYAIRNLARMPDRELRRYYRQVSHIVTTPYGDALNLGSHFDAKVFNLADAFGS